MFIVICTAFGVVFYFLGRHIYDNPETKANFERISQILSNQKRKLKGQEIKHDNDMGLAKSMKKAYAEFKDFNMMAVFAKKDEEAGLEMAENPGKVHENSVTPINNTGEEVEGKSQKDLFAELRLAVGQKVTKGIANGSSLQGLLHAQNLEENKKAKNMLAESRAKFEKDRYKKWLVCLVGVLIGGFLGYSIPTMLKVLTRSMYDRAGLDNLTLELLPDFKVTDATPDEVLICAYEYNS